jgi:hypothetical protein
MSAPSPLEGFVRDYIEATEGVWDEIEPQVYDVLLPAGAGGAEGGVVRIAFDPEALPEHPGAQLALFSATWRALQRQERRTSGRAVMDLGGGGG